MVEELLRRIVLKDFRKLVGITMYANSHQETLQGYCKIMGGHNLDLDNVDRPRFDLSFGDCVFTIYHHYVDNKLYVDPRNIESLDEVGKTYTLTYGDLKEVDKYIQERGTYNE